MKFRTLIIGAIFAFSALISHAQVFEMYSAGFEQGQPVHFSVSPTSGAVYDNSIKSSGNRSLKLVQSTSEDIVLISDTIDFTQNTTLRYIAMEFDHICTAPTTTSINIGMIYVKRPAQSDNEWTQLNGTQHYNRTNGGSSSFASLSNFNVYSYDAWSNATSVSNDLWKSERFDINDIITGSIPVNERKLMFKFVLKKHLGSASTAGNWWLDNIMIRSSQNQMITPVISMRCYPDGGLLPSSRGAKVVLDASTPVSQGINPDSVYLYYKVGSGNTAPIRLPMTRVTNATYAGAAVPHRYEARIPFEGFDTLMRFYCVVRDATTNANMATFPAAVDSWVEYRCVRGTEMSPTSTPAGFVGSTVAYYSALVPFSPNADNKCEWVYDSALLADAGYKPGAITDLRFTVAVPNSVQTREKFQIRMRNVGTNYEVEVPTTGGLVPFYSGYYQAVYDSTLVLQEVGSNAEVTIHLQDTFFYAGKDILMQVIYDNRYDGASTSVKMIPTVTGKSTLLQNGGEEEFNYNPYTHNTFKNASDVLTVRPSFVPMMHKHQALKYDLGVSEFVYPNEATPIASVPSHIDVKLKNYGSLPVNAVRISYVIDDATYGYYDWTGSLSGNGETTVTINNNVNLTPGYHYVRAWVEDSLTASGVVYRDHEPNNDSLFTRFIVCDGPLNGQKQIGGVAPDYNSIEEFLYTLSQCGVDDSLVVKLAPGYYPAFTIPSVPGISEQHYVVIRPLSGNVTIYADETMGVNEIVNMEQTGYFRFRDLKFVRRSGALTNMVTMGMESHGCRFERCTFVDSLQNASAALRIGSLLHSGFGNNLIVDACTFEGGAIGANIIGQASDMRSSGCVVKNCVFRNQYVNALSVQNQTDVLIDHNELYDVMSNSSYVMLLYENYGNMRILGNKIYTSHGAGGVGASNINGTSASHALIANNMVVCADDASANLLRTSFNIIQCDWLDAVYNSVKMTAPMRNNIAAATFGGGTITNSRFINNIVASFDDVNYAFNFIPGDATSNTVSNNIYYSLSETLNRYSGTSYSNLSAWQAAVPMDSLSASVNPGFLNGSLVDLRTYSRLVKGVGVPFPQVTVDMFDTLRSTVATCPGAFEFSSLFYDFEPEALVQPAADNCALPDNVELIVRVRNSGVSAYDPNGTVPLTIGYKVNNLPSHTVTVSRALPGEDTIDYHTGATVQLPPNGLLDATYTIKVWTVSANDPNQTNDTNVFTVVSRYHPAAPTDITVPISYATSATITPTAGVDTWAVYNNTSAPHRPSQIYWFANQDDEDPIAIGPSLTTDIIRMDTQFYFRQQREMPIVRITQVQLLKSNNTEGLTFPTPVWMANGTKVAIQLTNVGDGTAHLQGDTLMTVSSTSSLNNKVFTFGDISLAPGQSVVVQWTGGVSSFMPTTVHSGTSISPNYNANIGFVYRRGGVVEDAIPLNDVITASSTQAVKWSTQNVPNYVWTGSGVTVPTNTTGGFYRSAFNGNSTDWTVATNDNPLFLDRNNPSWIRYVDNGCPGSFATAYVTIIAPPTADIELSNLQLPEGCGLGVENVTVDVVNYGSQAINSLTLNYSAGGATVSEDIPGGIGGRSRVTYTFTQPLDLTVTSDSLFNVAVWATSVAGDPQHSNDTLHAEIWSRMTPGIPDYDSVRNVPYATRDTMVHHPASGVVPVWYNADMQPVDTGYTHITDILYTNQTMAVGYIVATSIGGQIGTGTTLTSKTAYPSPYQPNSKYGKQQYIYSAAELNAAGLQAGPITEVAFHLDSIWAGRDSVTFDEYYIALGLTTDTIFSGNSAWKPTEVVYHRSSMSLYQTDVHTWVSHQLDTPFNWDGTSSIVVQVSHSISSTITSGVQTQYTAKSNTTLHKNNASQLSPSIVDFVGSGTKGNNRPNIRLSNVNYGCIGSLSPIEINLIGIPNTDAAIYEQEGADTIVYNSCGNVVMDVDVRNLGLNQMDQIKLVYSIDGAANDSTLITTSLAPGQRSTYQLFDTPLLPGRHSVTAFVKVAGDDVASNDTLTIQFLVRFCAGIYSIATDTGDFHSFSAAIDTLNVVGIDGAVIFNVSPGTYNEQVVLNHVQGSSSVSTLTFRGIGDENPLLTASTSQASNYVFQLDGASNVVISNIRIEARPTANNVNYAHALVMQNADNIRLLNNTIRVKGTINNVNASCIVLGDDVTNLTLQGNTIDSGYYSLRATGTGYSNFTLRNNNITHFWYRGLEIRGLSNLEITSNYIRSGVSVNSRPLIGMSLSNLDGSVTIQRNHVYLIDDKSGGKRGIQLNNVQGTSRSWVFVKNNMISTSGSASAGNLAPSSGIYIDSSSAYINVYYNTARVYAGQPPAVFNPTVTNSVTSTAFYAGPTTTNIQVMNNIFANASGLYAYYVAAPTSVTSSNYNVYYTDCEYIAYWVTPQATLTDLQTTNGDDGSSLNERPYFTAPDDLHLLMTNFVDKAQYNTDVTDDIDGFTRPQIPAPTIGAHEMPRLNHDMSIVEIISPSMPLSALAPNNIEGDSVLVKASFYNNGIATETNVRWYAYIEGHESVTTTPIRNLGTFQSSVLKTDSVMMPTTLGIIDTHTLHVVLLVNIDSNMRDNDLTTPIYLAPAFNLEAVRMTAPEGCYLQNSTITITIKNSGFKDIPANSTVELGYHTQGYSPNFIPNNPNANKINIPTMVDTVREYHTLETLLPINASRTFTFNTTANLYPTDTAANIKVRVNGWCNYQYDVIPANDSTGLPTSSSPVINSWYTPAPPDGHDTTLAYGTWGAVTASQENLRPIRWYRDSLQAPFYTGNNYLLSTRWGNTPQYFHDSTYYLNCLSDKGCASAFSPVTVHVAPRIANDIAFEEILAPLGSRVYMSNDTVRVQIANYGTATQSNFPVTYELKRGNTVLQHVTEICTEPIIGGQNYAFTFDSLLTIPTPTTNQNYSLVVWTDLATDGTRRNDTIRTPYTFRSLAENTYCTPTTPLEASLNISRVAFNQIDFDIPPLSSGRAYNNLALYQNPEYPVLHLTRGTVDSVFVMLSTLNDTRAITANVAVYIDYDRSGEFTDNEKIAYNLSTLYTGQLFGAEVTIPDTASYGFMRMRVVACSGTGNPNPCLEDPGHVIDFMLHIDPEPLANDIALTQIASPRNHLIREEGSTVNDSSRVITFRMANKGTEHVSNVHIFYRYDALETGDNSMGDFVWTGSLMPGASTLVSLPEHVFPFGTTMVNIWQESDGDLDSTNNSLFYEYNRFHVITLTLRDNFDENLYWYAPSGNNEYSRNYWQLGTPAKTRIVGAYSEPNAWATDLTSTIVTGTRGNVSYLYSPVIDISVIKPDTLSFRLVRNLTNGSSLHIEYYDFENKWTKIEGDSADVWYNNAENKVFDGNSAGNAYQRYWISTKSISGNFQEKVQFRFVYQTPIGSNSNTSFGEGCAVDDFVIGRAQRGIDVGVIAITKPVEPKYGQTIYPEVVVKNFGSDTIRSLQLGYTHYGIYLPRVTNLNCILPPGQTDTFTMESPFIITNIFPDTFNITAFTDLPLDYYKDNDTTSRDFVLSPLANDIAAEAFITPLERVIAGDTAVVVNMRIRNFGESSISRARATYVVNGVNRVDEDIDFEEILGRPLASLEYFNYTFRQRFHATMGMMDIVGIIKCDSNEYIYNDTITKRLHGISSITDLAAAGVVVDQSLYDSVRFELVIDNLGARGANGFEVGFWIDNDTTTMVREIYGREYPLPALETGYHVFSTKLKTRPAGYDIVSGYVKAAGDNDPSNDTTNVVMAQKIDLALLGIIVEERASNDCRVFVQVRNIGNVALIDKTYQFIMLINGNSDGLTFSTRHRIEAGQTVTLECPRTIPKDPMRHYQGYCTLDTSSFKVDVNPANNTTTNIIVKNYVDDIPDVNAGQIVLDQNFPNPFTNRTTVPFTLPEAAQVKFFVMDAMGHMLHSQSRFYPAGSNTIMLDMDNYSAGVYYYGIEVDGVRQMRKMILR